MGVGNPVPVHHHSNPLTFKFTAHNATNRLRHYHQSGRRCIVDIGKMIDVLLGNDNALTWTCGSKSHEGEEIVALGNYACRRRSVYYSTKRTVGSSITLGHFTHTRHD